MTIRQRTYQAVSLGEVLNLESGEAPGERTIPAVLIECKQGALCLLVDQLIGHRQAVVSSLKEVLPGVHNVDGVAPVEGGKLALVLNVPEVVKEQMSAQET